MKDFWYCFVPIFVAVDPFGILPLYMGMTAGMGQRAQKKVVAQSVGTALAVSLLFLYGGVYLLRILGLTVADFMVAGGIVLFIMSVTDLLTMEKTRRKVEPEEVGAVPIGVPLMAGPALFTSSLLLVNEFGFTPTALAIVANIILAGIVFMLSGQIFRILGKSGTKTVSKLASLLLAAISVMIVRKGIMLYLQS